MLFLCVSLASVVRDVWWEEYVKGTLQLCVTLCAAVAMVASGRQTSVSLFKRLALAGLALVVVGSALEVLGLTAGLSEFVRSNLYGRWDDAEARDVLIAGIRRPTVFTAEPAHVAFYALMCGGVIVAACGRSVGVPITVTVSLVALLWLNRSPIVVVAIVYVWCIYIGVHMRNASVGRRVGVGAVALACVAAFGIAAGSFLPIELKERFERILTGSDSSALARVYGPVLLAGKIVRDRPLLGVGVCGDLEPIQNEVDETFTELTGRFATGVVSGRAICNALWLHWVYFGILGGVAFIGLWHWFLSTLLTRMDCFVVHFHAIIVGSMIGDYVTLRFWGMIAILGATLVAVRFEMQRGVKDRDAEDVSKNVGRRCAHEGSAVSRSINGKGSREP